MYGKGTLVEKDIYEINGFQIRFFTKSDIEDIVTKTGFNLFKISEANKRACENYYCVYTNKSSYP